MTISSVTDKTIGAGNGATTVFSFNFLIQSAAQLAVIYTDANGNQTPISAGNYSVAFTPGTPGGTVTYNPGGVPIASSTTLTMYRTVALTQLTNLRNQGSYNPTVVEAALDYLTMIAQQVSETVGRGISVPIVDANPVVTLPAQAARKNTTLGFDANGTLTLLASLGSTPISGYMTTMLTETTAALARGYLGSTATGDALFTAASVTAALNTLGVSAFIQTLLNDADAPTARATLGFSDSGFTTGDVKLSMKTAADAGWVLMNDTTIGDASSGASGRANADTSALFTLLWTNTADTDCPVSGGRGGSAAADFAAHKTLALPRALGRALANYGAGSTVEAVTASSGNGFVVGSNNTRWITGMPVVLSNLTGFTTSATAGPTYYVVRISATNIRLATTLALAQAGTPDVTISGSGTCTLTYSLTNRALGAWTGEEAHAMSSTELLSHTHPLSSGAASNVVSPNQGNANGTGSTAPAVTVGSTGGNAAANITQPTLFLNVMIKL